MKNIIIYGLPRTGTTYVHRLVSYFMWRKYSNNAYTIFDEFFSNTLKRYICHYKITNRNGIVNKVKKCDFYEMESTTVATETEQRILDTLSSHNEETPMISKLHVGNIISSPIKQHVYDYLNETSNFILVERDDMLNLVLSLTLARLTGVYNSYNSKSLPDYPKYSVTIDTFIEVFRWKYDYEKYKKTLKNVIGTINFNDIGVSEEGILKDLNFNNSHIFKNIDLSNVPVKLISNERKWELLENKEQALMWYNEIFGQ